MYLTFLPVNKMVSVHNIDNSLGRSRIQFSLGRSHTKQTKQPLVVYFFKIITN